MNFYNLPRGTICVERAMYCRIVWLAIDPQGDYAEWAGCFCVI